MESLAAKSQTGEVIQKPVPLNSKPVKAWRRAVAAAGPPAGVGFHALRHYYASLLIRHGESVKLLQLRLGQATAPETLDVYSHLRPDSENRTREAVDAVLGLSADSLRTSGHTE